ncbi:methyltransferase B [Lophiotrema nucula]|uniref:Methyltransferase B n=1 Tax=Lophiotrema nucula TaxID=690887 RepID=A0A6A5YXC3_9PLEO|nr:methyltransferase B [Lophiotrema nucula]
MNAITSQVRALYTEADEEGRRKLQTDLRDLQTSLDTDWSIVIRLSSGMLTMSLVKIGSDLHIFETLSGSQQSFKLGDLAATTGASRGLLGHLLRASAAFGLISETDKDEFSANRLTKALANVNVAGAIEHAFDVHASVALALPSYFKERKYQDVTSNLDLAFHKALNTDLPPFEWMKQHPEQMKSLGHAMAMQREGHWIDSYPVEEEVGTFSPTADSALLVDIGGGFGQQAAAFKNRFPSLPGRILVQDIAETLDHAPQITGIDFQVQDFFQPQAIIGAKFYYLRHILHDWTDDDSVRILKSIVPAMGPKSRIVIDEIVLPDKDVPWQAAYMDLTMMGSLGGVERTKSEYEAILDRAGLKLVGIHKYDPKLQSVILAVPKY